jgi:hypothetical protein
MTDTGRGSLFPVDTDADREKIENEYYAAAMEKYREQMRKNKKRNSDFREGNSVMVLIGIRNKDQDINEVKGTITLPPAGKMDRKTCWVRLESGNTAQCDCSLIRGQ